jgi:hypothetical protein
MLCQLSFFHFFSGVRECASGTGWCQAAANTQDTLDPGQGSLVGIDSIGLIDYVSYYVYLFCGIKHNNGVSRVPTVFSAYFLV